MSKYLVEVACPKCGGSGTYAKPHLVKMVEGAEIMEVAITGCMCELCNGKGKVLEIKKYPENMKLHEFKITNENVNEIRIENCAMDILSTSESGEVAMRIFTELKEKDFYKIDKLRKLFHSKKMFTIIIYDKEVI
jgi:RecJ-like exonuclease